LERLRVKEIVICWHQSFWNEKENCNGDVVPVNHPVVRGGLAAMVGTRFPDGLRFRFGANKNVGRQGKTSRGSR
jgi:hypothetical protein